VRVLLFAFIFLFAGVLHSADVSKVKWRLDTKESGLKSLKAKFTAPAGHHFNDQAPNRVEVKSVSKPESWLPVEKIEVKGQSLSATWGQEVDLCHVKATLFICDDKNTYCLPKTQTIDCKVGTKKKTSLFYFKEFSELFLSQAEASAADDIGTSPVFEDGFIANDTKKALGLAKENHKPLLIDFYGIWCPPCNQLNEMVFNTAEFSKASKNYILLKLDADQPESWALKSKYKIKGYPTVVFADENAGELTRLVGAREKTFFVGEMNRILKDKLKSFEHKKELADKGDANAAFELGKIFLNREEFDDAYVYLLKASRSWAKSDKKNNDLLSASLGVFSKAQDEEGKRRYVKILKDALAWYPHAEETIDRGGELAKVAEALGDTASQKEGLRAVIDAGHWFLSHQAKLKKMEATKGDLFEIVGDAYSDLGEKEKSQEAFSKASDNYLAQIKAAGLDEKTERAFNLERIYCIWKSGKTELANSLYESLEKVYPKEFTFYYQHAKLLQDLKQTQTASEKARQAFEYSYGDNKLRVAALLADLLADLEKKPEAIKVLDETMSQAQLPTDSSIRSHRYYDKLKTLRKKIAGA
jgi:thiol-disulfide isomerase/thioredoxin